MMALLRLRIWRLKQAANIFWGEFQEVVGIGLRISALGTVSIQSIIIRCGYSKLVVWRDLSATTLLLESPAPSWCTLFWHKVPEGWPFFDVLPRKVPVTAAFAAYERWHFPCL
jgi:hypothetical protein